MTAPNVPDMWRTWMARFMFVVVSTLLLCVGVLFDSMGVANVPGAATLSGEALVPSSLGTGLVLLVAVAWVTIFWRARQPLLVWAMGFVIATIGMSYLMLLVGAVHVIRRYPSRLRAVAIITVSAVALYALRESTTAWGAVTPWLFGRDVAPATDPRWVLVTWLIALISLGVTASVVMTSQSRARAAQSEVRAEDEQHRADALSEQMVRQAERERIARDMHDALAHRLSVVSLHAGALEASSPHDESAELARTVREQTHAALQDMRGLIGDLRSGPAESSPASMRAIAALIADFRAMGAHILGLVVIESPERASIQLDSSVFRIAQEALTNAIKHAPGALIDVYVHVTPETGARIRIVNELPGIGGSAVPGGGHGAVGMRERAEALGGEAWIGPHEGSHYVDVTLPWQERA